MRPTLERPRVEPAKLRDQLFAAARRDFPAFFAVASGRDVLLFECLVFARATLAVSMNSPRANLPEHIRTELERVTHGNEILFTELREEVRRSAGFLALPDAEQLRIERTLFDVKPPLFS